MSALLTGSAEFIGLHMVAALLTREWDVTAIDVRLASYGWRADAVGWFQRDSDVYDLVVHAAAVAPHRAAIDGQPASHITNQLLDAAMFEWAVRTDQRRVLYLSSCAALDPVPDAYGLLKLTGERMAGQARAAGVPVTVVRPYSGYGEDQGEDWPFGAFVARAKRREDPFEIWGDGTQVRDWIHIDDVVAGALALVDAGVDGPVSLCTGIPTSLRYVARAICRAAGYEPEFKTNPAGPAGVASRVGDPTELHRYHTPRVTLADGIRRALA